MAVIKCFWYAIVLSLVPLFLLAAVEQHLWSFDTELKSILVELRPTGQKQNLKMLVESEVAAWVQGRDDMMRNHVKELEDVISEQNDIITVYHQNTTVLAKSVGSATMEIRKLRSVIQQRGGSLQTTTIGVLFIQESNWSCEMFSSLRESECPWLRTEMRFVVSLPQGQNNCTNHDNLQGCTYTNAYSNLSVIDSFCKKEDLSVVLLLQNDVQLCESWLIHIQEIARVLTATSVPVSLARGSAMVIPCNPEGAFQAMTTAFVDNNWSLYRRNLVQSDATACMAQLKRKKHVEGVSQSIPQADDKLLLLASYDPKLKLFKDTGGEWIYSY